MKEIDDDILDWGFVDDGLNDIPAPALASSPWQIEDAPTGEWIVNEWDGNTF